jgi:hypothetical protein
MAAESLAQRARQATDPHKAVFSGASGSVMPDLMQSIGCTLKALFGGLQLSQQAVLALEPFSVVPGVSLTHGEAFQQQAQLILSPEALLAWIPLGSLWKFNPPLRWPLDHNHWAQELNLVQILLMGIGQTSGPRCHCRWNLGWQLGTHSAQCDQVDTCAGTRGKPASSLVLSLQRCDHLHLWWDHRSDFHPRTSVHALCRPQGPWPSFVHRLARMPFGSWGGHSNEVLHCLHVQAEAVMRHFAKKCSGVWPSPCSRTKTCRASRRFFPPATCPHCAVFTLLFHLLQVTGTAAPPSQAQLSHTPSMWCQHLAWPQARCQGGWRTSHSESSIATTCLSVQAT